MDSTDYLRIKEHKIFKELHLPEGITKSMNLLCSLDNILFTWDFRNCYALSLNLKAARSKEGDNVIHQKLMPVRPPLFTPEFLIVNDSGTLLIVAARDGIMVLELPNRSPPYGAFDNNKEVVYCRSHSLEERLLACSDSVHVRQIRFHPGSLHNNHILILTSDNILRLFMIHNQEVFNLETFSVGEKPIALFPGSRTPFLDLYGEVSVDFEFGEPEIFEPVKPPYEYFKYSTALTKSNNKVSDGVLKINAETQTVDKIVPINPKKEKQDDDWTNLVWPIYILRSNLSVFSIKIDLKKRLKPILKGPLPMSSRVNEEMEACSLAYLKTVPPVLAIAASNGNIYHSLLLDIEQDTIVKIRKKNDIPAENLPEKELLIFEMIELELGLITCEEDLNSKYTCPVFLNKDASKPGRYYASHTTGVHSVVLNCEKELARFVNSPEGAKPTSDIFLRPSKADYLVCTKTVASEKINPVVGFAVYYEPESIITLLSDASVVTLGIMWVGELPNVEDLLISTENTKISPFKTMLQESFDLYIEKILKKTYSLPVLKLPSTGQNGQEQCYELLQRAAQVFREGYFKNNGRTKEELEKRIQTLTMMKKNQQREIENLMKEKDSLQEKASSLAERYEDVKDKQDYLLGKAEHILMLVSKKSSTSSGAEKEFINELNEYKQKISVYQQRIEKIRQKYDYQRLQIKTWKNGEKNKVSTINQKHVDTIKSSLTETTKKLQDMQRKILMYKKELNLK